MHRELALLERARAGDLVAFERLIAPHLPRVHRLVTHLCDRPDEAEALLFEAVHDAWHHLASLGREPLGSWLVKVFAASAVRRLRSREGEDRLPPRSAQAAAPWPEHPVGGPVRRAIRRGVRRLPVAHRVVFLLCDVEGLSAHEVAGALDRPPAEVRRLLHEARLGVIGSIDAACAPGAGVPGRE